MPTPDDIEPIRIEFDVVREDFPALIGMIVID